MPMPSPTALRRGRRARGPGERWHTLRRLPEACGAMACIALAERIHIIGGAIGSENRRSIDWHLVYDPRTDRYAAASRCRSAATMPASPWWRARST